MWHRELPPFCAYFYAESVNGCVLKVSRLLLPPQSVLGLMSGLVGGIQPTKVKVVGTFHVPST
jgi:hypothetical protein